jgi:hypothetical protein
VRQRAHGSVAWRRPADRDRARRPLERTGPRPARDRTSAQIRDRLGAGLTPPPKLRAAVCAWLWYMDGAILDWLEHRDLDRAELRDLLIGSLAGALGAADAVDLLPGCALLVPGASPLADLRWRRRRVLALKIAGFRYGEIMERLGLTYTNALDQPVPEWVRVLLWRSWR